MAVRSERYQGLPDSPVAILLHADWQMMSMLNVLLLVVAACILYHTEYADNALLKMCSLPLRESGLFFGKLLLLVPLLVFTLALEAAALGFCCLHWLAFSQESLAKLACHMGFSLMLLSVGMYFVSAAVAGHTQDYPFILPCAFVLKEAGLMFMAGIPMLAFFWLLSVCIQTPVFSVGIGLASIVPSVLIINTKLWFVYPMSYSFFVIVAEYGKLATALETAPAELFPWIPVAVGITFLCLGISCLCFGRTERK